MWLFVSGLRRSGFVYMTSLTRQIECTQLIPVFSSKKHFYMRFHFGFSWFKVSHTHTHTTHQNELWKWLKGNIRYQSTTLFPVCLSFRIQNFVVRVEFLFGSRTSCHLIFVYFHFIFHENFLFMIVSWTETVRFIYREDNLWTIFAIRCENTKSIFPWN